MMLLFQRSPRKMSEDRAVDSDAPAAGQYEPLMNVLMRESHGNFKRFLRISKDMFLMLRQSQSLDY